MQKAGDRVTFACPARAGDDGCDILVSDNGVVTATGGATVSLTATALQGRIAPFATGATVTMPMLTRMPTDVTISLALGTSAIERYPDANAMALGARNANALRIATGASAWTDGDILTGATVELPMRAVTVGDPPDPDGLTGTELANSHVVHTYIDGPRGVTTQISNGIGGTAGLVPGSDRTIEIYIGVADNVYRSTNDQFQYPTYVLSDADVVSSIELDNDRGVTVRLGGKGVISVGGTPTTVAQGLAFADMKTGTEARPAAAPDLTGASTQAERRTAVHNWGTAVREWAARNHGDLTIKFGKDAYREDPHGDGAHYWEADVEFAVGGTAGAPDGTYQLWLSNRAGAVSASVADAEYLQYAAYGLFNFMDRTMPPAKPFCATSLGVQEDCATDGDRDYEYAPVSARLQGLHFGFDTPATGANSIATLRALGTTIGATWSGRTTALAMTAKGARFLGTLPSCQTGTCTTVGGWIATLPPTETLVRMRGDVKLYACFGAGGNCTIDGAPGGTTPANDIEGMITNMQALVDNGAGNDVWRSTRSGDAFHTTGITLGSTPIDENGAFSAAGISTAASTAGSVTSTPDFVFGGSRRGTFAEMRRWRGSWNGRFYGPVDIGKGADATALDAGDGPAEVAGWWVLPGYASSNTRLHTVVGAFGATLDDPPDPDPMTP